MFENGIFERILESWRADQEHPHRDRIKKLLPSIADLKALIEVSFFASLKREEDKPISFALVLLAKHEARKEQETSSRKQLILSFPESLPFKESSIIKLSSAFDIKTSALLVGPKENNQNEYEIWGVMFFRATQNRFTQIPAALHGYNYFRPDLLMVTTISPGSLVISRADIQIGHFSSGIFTPATPTPFTSKAMGKYMIEYIKEDKLYKEFKNLYWHIFRDSMEYLLLEASMWGHGGTIVFVPENIQAKCKEKYSGGYSFNQDFDFEKLLIYLLKSDIKNDLLFSVLNHRILAEHLSFLAQLSCVDGALILTSRFKPLAFGVTLNPNEWTGKVISGPNGIDNTSHEINNRIWGTRHNSVISFTGDFPGVFSFVISQDGPIRGFAKKDDATIFCWEDCRISMFV